MAAGCENWGDSSALEARNPYFDLRDRDRLILLVVRVKFLVQTWITTVDIVNVSQAIYRTRKTYYTHFINSMRSWHFFYFLDVKSPNFGKISTFYYSTSTTLCYIFKVHKEIELYNLNYL